MSAARREGFVSKFAVNAVSVEALDAPTVCGSEMTLILMTSARISATVRGSVAFQYASESCFLLLFLMVVWVEIESESFPFLPL